jgi:hypothetical protein
LYARIAAFTEETDPGELPSEIPGAPKVQQERGVRTETERFFAAWRRVLAYRESSTKSTAASLAKACTAGTFARDDRGLLVAVMLEAP